MDIGDVAHTCTGILLSHKNDETLPFSTTLDESWEYHAKWNKSDAKGQKPYDFTDTWKIQQKTTSKQRKQTNRDTDAVSRFWKGREVGVSRVKKAKHLVTGDDSGWWATRHTDDALQNHTPETYMLLTNVAPTNIVKRHPLWVGCSHEAERH